MINVSLEKNGDVVYKCGAFLCDMKTVIPKSAAQSMFWEVFHGHAVLAMIGHAESVHRKQEAEVHHE
jgi:hypothetical protein